MIPGEKKFYLQSFRHRSVIIFAAHPYTGRHVRHLVRELVDNGTVVVAVAANVSRKRGPIDVAIPRLDGGVGDDLVELGSRLLDKGEAWVRKPSRLQGVRALDFACRLAVRLGVHKLVVADPRGGLAGPSGIRSFIDAPLALRLAHSGADLGGWRPNEIERIVEAIKAGVESVNLVAAEALDAELFTYEGAGTLVTADDYCRVAPLRLDDFAQAHDLIDRGEKEGFLLTREAYARARLLLCGYGAWFEGRLAGVGGLETELYRRDRVAEIIGLYTITRFKGEGVGSNIVDHLLGVAEEKSFRSVFACTSNDRAAEFFLRNGFERVSSKDVPREKWKHRRGRRPMTFLREL